MKSIQPKGILTTQILAMPADTNSNGDIFGGWLVSHMDMGGGIEASRLAQCRIVTVAIDQMVFIKPVKIGDVVSCYANLLSVGTTSMRFKLEVWTLSMRDKKLKHVATGIFTYVAIDEKGKPQPVYR